MTAVWMLSWEMVARHRWIFRITAIGFLLICFVVPLLPESQRNKNVAVPLTMLAFFVFPVLLTDLSHGWEGRLERRASAFPARLFTLPVSTVTLVLVPLVASTLLIVIPWMLVVLAVMWPCRVPVPLLWPGVMAAAFVAWMQAMSWTAFPLPWLRLVVFVVVLPIFPVGGIVLCEVGVSEPALVALFGSLTVGGYGLAIRGVWRGRRGEGFSEPSRVVSGTRDRTDSFRPFSSPALAQFWYERRIQTFQGMIMFGLSILWLVPLIHMTAQVLQSQEYLLEVLPLVKAAVEKAGVGWVAVSQLLIWPAVVCVFSGVELGRFGKACPPVAFVLTRPIETAEFVRAKMLLAGWAMLLMWLLLAGIAATWAAVTGHLPDMANRLVEWAGSWPAALAVLAGGLLLGWFVTWLWLVRGLWAGLLGWSPLGAVPAIEGALVGVVATMAVRGWMETPWLRPWLVALLVQALLLKTAAVAWAMRRLWHRRLIAPATLLICVLCWSLGAVTVAGLTCWFVGGAPVCFGGVLLLLPLAQPLSATLALDHVRHR